ncbi:MAG: hypothetical protein KA004_04510 [Verrucomicrobiales bacterium]|nr:hypothetical protein [Verrucomicrobiales bacterium]
MDKLYYIVCEEQQTSLYEGRYQGRTRGAALRFLKEQINRRSLKGLVFTITEIPVPLIEAIVAEKLAELLPGMVAAQAPPANAVTTPAPGRFDAFAGGGNEAPGEPAAPAAAPVAASAQRRTKKAAVKVGNPGHGDDFWAGVRTYWSECRNTRQTAEKFGISPNSVKTRAYRENWRV